MSVSPSSPPAPAAREGGATSGSGRAALFVSAGIVASRLIGLVRQSAVAHVLGTGAVADAVAAAFRVGNITQNLLGEGTLGASFVPVYARLRKSSPERAQHLARSAFGVLLCVVIGLSALGMLLARPLTRVIAAGLEGATFDLAAELTRNLFPMTGLLVLGAWALGILTAHRRFLTPYMAPVLWSLAQIVALVIASRVLHAGAEDVARAITWGALAGAALQLLVLIVPVHGLIGSVVPRFDTHAEGLRDAARRFPGALAGRGVLQISSLIDTALVTLLGTGALATFQYAQTAYLLPMAVLGAGEAAAALPELAEKDPNSDDTKRSILDSMGRTLTRVCALAFGAAAVFGTLAPEVIGALFQRGRFDASSTAAVATVLTAYALSLPANAASRIFGTACFALGDTRRPATFATVRVVVSTIMSLILMRSFGVAGVVLGAVFAAWVELALLIRTVRAMLGGTGLGAVPFARILLAAAVPAAVGLALRHVLAPLTLGPLLRSLAVLSVSGVGFLIAIDRLGVLGLRAILRRRR